MFKCFLIMGFTLILYPLSHPVFGNHTLIYLGENRAQKGASNDSNTQKIKLSAKTEQAIIDADPDGELRRIPNFPCDLSSFTELPPIILSTESDHYDFDTELDKRLRKSDAKANYSRLGLEGELFSGMFTDGTDGIEDPVAFGVAQSVGAVTMIRNNREKFFRERGAKYRGLPAEIQDQAFFSDIGIRYIISGIIPVMKKNPVLKEAWKTLRRPLKGKEEQVGKYFDRLFENPDKETFTVLDPFPEDLIVSYDAMIATFDKLSDASVSLALEKYGREKGTPKNLRELVKQEKGNQDRETYKEIVLKMWRNHYWIKNLLEMYCRAAKDSKELWVIMGTAHADDIENMIHTASGKKVSVRHHDPIKYQKKLRGEK